MHQDTTSNEKPAGDEPISFGERVRRLLAERGMSQAELAKVTGLDRTELNRTINGRRHVQHHEIPWIAKALGMTVEELLKGVELPEPVRRARQELEGMAKRVLDAEGERDTAREQVASLEQLLADERSAHGARMRELEGRLQSVQAESAAVRAQAESVEMQLRADVRNAQTKVEGLAQAVTKLAAERHSLLQQLVTTRAELTTAQGAKVATGVLAGLAGLWLGSTGRGGDDDDGGS